MRSFAFINHPYNLNDLRAVWPQARILPAGLLRAWSKNILPIKTATVHLPVGKDGSLDGIIVDCPLLPQQIMDLGPEAIFEKVIATGRRVKERGARIVGLGGCDSVMEEIGFTIGKTLNLPVTSGSAYTAWSVFEAVYRLAKDAEINLSQSRIAVIGANSSAGLLCAKKFCHYASGVVLCDGHPSKLETLKNKVIRQGQCAVTIEPDQKKAVKDADVIVVLSPEEQPDLARHIKPGALVCSLAHSVLLTRRTDIVSVRAGLIKVPFTVPVSFHTALAPGVVSTALAETILLTLEGRFVNYSLGQEINIDKLDEIADIGARHGFEVWLPQVKVP